MIKDTNIVLICKCFLLFRTWRCFEFGTSAVLHKNQYATLLSTHLSNMILPVFNARIVLDINSDNIRLKFYKNVLFGIKKHKKFNIFFWLTWPIRQYSDQYSDGSRTVRVPSLQQDKNNLPALPPYPIVRYIWTSNSLTLNNSVIISLPYTSTSLLINLNTTTNNTSAQSLSLVSGVCSFFVQVYFKFKVKLSIGDW